MGHDYNAKMGHSILRYKVRLYDRHFSWLVITRELYTKVQENRKLYQKLEDINNYYTHKISWELLNFCQEKNIKVIVVPNCENSIEDYRKQCNSDVYRCRSMRIDAEKNGVQLSTGAKDDRVTPVGRFIRKVRIDELPEFHLRL